MTHSAAMASEAIVGKTLLEAVNTDLVCDAINTAMRELFLQIIYGRTQSAFSENGLPVGAGLEDLGKGTRSQVGTVYSTKVKGPRYLDLAEGYILQMGLDENNEIIGYEYVNMGVFMDAVKKGVNPEEALNNAKKTYGRYADAVKYIDPRTRIGGKIMALFEGYERRIDKINEVLNTYGISSIEEAKKLCDDLGVDVYNIVKGIQPICFENACWAYIAGAAIAIKKGDKTAYDVAKSLGEGLQSFCIPGSVADDRKVGLGHGNLAAMLLSDETKCFAFLAGHESFAAAEGAIGIARNANKARKEPLRVILNGLGKDAAKIISRINGFTYVETQFDYFTGELKELSRTAYSREKSCS